MSTKKKMREDPAPKTIKLKVLHKRATPEARQALIYTHTEHNKQTKAFQGLALEMRQQDTLIEVDGQETIKLGTEWSKDLTSRLLHCCRKDNHTEIAPLLHTCQELSSHMFPGGEGSADNELLDE